MAGATEVVPKQLWHAQTRFVCETMHPMLLQHLDSRSHIWAMLALFVLVVARPARAQFACPTADEVRVQQALDAAAAAGGGTVELGPGILQTCQTLLIRSNVHLKGAGRGATIVRGSSAITGKSVNGAYIGATIGGAGVNNVSVSDLTVDHWSYSRNANGISFVPTGIDYTGTIPTNWSIERVEIFGSGVAAYHNYMIWNLKGQHVKIIHNWVTGGFPIPVASPVPQEGIETFGGYDVLISGNSVQGVGGACINAGSAGIPASDTVGLRITENYVFGCDVGIHTGTSSENGGQNNVHTLIQGNVIMYARSAGIDVRVAPGTFEKDLQIVGNSIRVIGPSDQAVGIHLLSGSTSISGTIVERNHVELVTGANAHGIRLVSYPNARIVGNFVSQTAAQGIHVYASDDVELARNRIERAGAYGMYIGPFARRIVVDDNLLSDWAISSPAVLLQGGFYGVIRNNSVKRSDGAISPSFVVQSSCGVELTGNYSLYPGAAVNGRTDPCR
jgi:hypothetical protein